MRRGTCPDESTPVAEQARGMTTTELYTRPSAYPSAADFLAEEVPLVGVIPVAGPPLILLAGPLVLFALLLAGPFVLVLTLVIAMAAAAALVGLVAAIVVSPYFLVRHLRASLSGYGSRHSPAAQLAAASRNGHHFFAQLEATS
jgi:hypothetical protein